MIDEKRAVGIELPKDAYNKLESEPTADPADVPDGLLDARLEMTAVETGEMAGGGGGVDESGSEADEDEDAEESEESEESEEEGDDDDDDVEEESDDENLASSANDFA